VHYTEPIGNDYILQHAALHSKSISHEMSSHKHDVMAHLYHLVIVYLMGEKS